jgi:hypothetical protein
LQPSLRKQPKNNVPLKNQFILLNQYPIEPDSRKTCFLVGIGSGRIALL